MSVDTFDNFEEKLKKLHESHAKMEDENSKILSLIKVKNSELEWLKERLKSLDKEKGLVKAKVDGLVDSINERI